MKNYIDSVEQFKMLANHRNDFLRRSCFSKWFEMMPELKKEKLEYEMAKDEIISKFRYVNIKFLLING
jgi:hypothetical protein